MLEKKHSFAKQKRLRKKNGKKFPTFRCTNQEWNVIDSQFDRTRKLFNLSFGSYFFGQHLFSFSQECMNWAHEIRSITERKGDAIEWRKCQTMIMKWITDVIDRNGLKTKRYRRNIWKCHCQLSNTPKEICLSFPDKAQNDAVRLCFFFLFMIVD